MLIINTDFDFLYIMCNLGICHLSKEEDMLNWIKNKSCFIYFIQSDSSDAPFGGN